MANSASTLRGTLKTLIATVIGEGAKELAFSVDIEKNKLRADSKGYAVIIGSPEETEGVTRQVTTDQLFSIVLTEPFTPSATGDQSKLTAADTLYDRLENIYHTAINTKAGSPSIVMRVFGRSGGDIEYVDNVAVLRATITIKYRQAL